MKKCPFSYNKQPFIPYQSNQVITSKMAIYELGRACIAHLFSQIPLISIFLYFFNMIGLVKLVYVIKIDDFFVSNAFDVQNDIRHL